MGKTRVLDTETTGTGAHMVPLEETLARDGAARELSLVELGGIDSAYGQVQGPRMSFRPCGSGFEVELQLTGVDRGP